MSGYHGGMKEPSEARHVSVPRVSSVGYAIGVGLAFMAVVGVFARFAFAAAPDLLLLGGSFLVGAALGAFRARATRVDLSD